MKYRFVTEKENYEDFAPGRVILAKSGSTSFPVRLASEIFQRCAQFFPDANQLTVYDPCCGSGYLLTVLSFLHGEKITALRGSDIDAEMVAFASDNLSLLTHEGLEKRRKSLVQLADNYNKASHHDAILSADKLAKMLPPESIDYAITKSSAFTQSFASKSVDLIICDVPYGDRTAWQGITEFEDPIKQLLDVQYDVLGDDGIIALISDKQQKAVHPHYTQLQHETIGKRRFVILQKT